MTEFAIATAAIGVAVWGIVKAAKTAAGNFESSLNRFWPLIALLVGVALAWIPGALDYVTELAGGDLELTASPAAKTITGLVGGGCSAAYHSLWRTTLKGR